MHLWARLKAKIAANKLAVIASIVIITAVLFIPNRQYRWIGHAIIGLTAFSFVVVTVTYGAIVVRRIKRPTNPARFRRHQKLGIVTGAFLTTALIFGLGTVFAREYPLLVSLHGRVALVILALAVGQITTGLAYRHRRKWRLLVHRWNGYLLAGLIVVQIILGVLLSPLVAGETPRYTLRIQTPPVPKTWSPDGVIDPGEYFFKRVVSEGYYEISYRTDGKYLYIGLKVKTTGWVGVGLQLVASKGMQDADIIFGYVSNGKAVVIDSFGVSRGKHLPDTELGGTDDIVAFGGKEEDGYTIIEFKRPLVTDDRFDIPLVEGNTESVIWAYGVTDSPEEKHVSQGFFDLAPRETR